MKISERSKERMLVKIGGAKLRAKPLYETLDKTLDKTEPEEAEYVKDLKEHLADAICVQCERVLKDIPEMPVSVVGMELVCKCICGGYNKIGRIL